MNMIFKTVASDGGLEFVLSDETVDRYGDIIMAAGWVLTNFKKNPIALFGHSNGFPIGTWTDVRVEGNKLVAKLKLAARGTSARIDELISLVEQGVLRAVSVGFIPIKSEPINPDRPYGPQRYTKQELLETSLVSVPANPSALTLAKQLNISSETMSLAFGEHAEVRRKDVSNTGEHAASPPATKAPITMKTLSQRIEDAQTALVAKKDKLSELTGADTLDETAIGELTSQIDAEEKTVATLKAAEAKIGAGAVRDTPTVPAQARKPLGHQEKNGMDLLVKALVVRGTAHFGGMSIEKALEARYPGHEAVGIIAKADQTIGTTTGSHWADDLVQTAYLGFIEALAGHSIFPDLLGRGLSLTFDRWGTLTMPRRTAGGAGGGFVAEGAPIRVGKITTASASLTPKKMGVIVAFSKELAKRSTPAIEGIVRQAILEDTAAILDPILLDATAASTARPAGLLNGVAAVGVGFAGGDYQAVKEDIKALVAPFHTANAADGIVVLMNPTQGLNMSLMDGPVGDPNWMQRIKDRVSFIESTNVPAGRLIAIRASDFAGAGGDPDFDVSEQATIHMEDTTPLEIVSGTGPTTADPVRSLWQTASVGVRMLMDVSWTMRRDGMVSWVNGTSW
ncbi:phage major capsid protein [Azospirillum sp.]|uniref:phage major capsid protein n=1 Tax=Azospirillum sp. TaxID=34012 RepID=UPI002D5D8FB9|nr:phage major capsid protein [Azospirillum sp.]HYD66188.1 phage major capsid protein [Azospirillum sp.]